MPELLGDAGVYFNPEDPDDIARALRELIDSPDLRARLAKSSFERAQAFSWQRCASETFGFLAEVEHPVHELFGDWTSLICAVLRVREMWRQTTAQEKDWDLRPLMEYSSKLISC